MPGELRDEAEPVGDAHVAGTDATAIPLAGPWVTDREVAAVAHAARHSWFEHGYDENGRFEREFAAATGRAHAIALPSCTSALHLCLLALGVGPGDEVIVPETTWIATAAPISTSGRHRSSSMSIRKLGACPLTPARGSHRQYSGDHRRRPVRRLPQTGRTRGIGAGFGIDLIEDSAEAAGGCHGSRPAGSFGITSTFSFHGSKTLTTGEGGMVSVRRRSSVATDVFLRDHGRLPGDVTFRSVEVAWKYKMSELQAAFGRVQLDRIDELIDRKRQIFGWYAERLAEPRHAERRARRATGARTGW